MVMKEIFQIKDLEGVHLTIPLPDTEQSKLKDITKSLEKSNFKTTKAYMVDFHNIMNDIFPEITFNGLGFDIAITKTKVAIQFLSASEFANLSSSRNSEKIDEEKIFAKEN